MTSKRKLICLFFCGLVLLCGIFFSALNYNGFCIAQRRFLSPEEHIRAVVSNINDLHRIPVETSEAGTQYFPTLKYQNADEILQKFPDCCRIARGGDVSPPTLWERITGRNSNVIVHVRYPVKYVDNTGTESSTKIDFDGVLSNCGTAVR